MKGNPEDICRALAMQKADRRVKIAEIVDVAVRAMWRGQPKMFESCCMDLLAHGIPWIPLGYTSLAAYLIEIGMPANSAKRYDDIFRSEVEAARERLSASGSVAPVE